MDLPTGTVITDDKATCEALGSCKSTADLSAQSAHSSAASTCVATNSAACSTIGDAGTNTGDDCNAAADCTYTFGATATCTLPQTVTADCIAHAALDTTNPGTAGADCTADAACTFDTGACGATTDPALCIAEATNGQGACVGVLSCDYDAGVPAACEATHAAACGVAGGASNQEVCNGLGDCTFTAVDQATCESLGFCNNLAYTTQSMCELPPGTCEEAGTPSVTADAINCDTVAALTDSTACDLVTVSTPVPTCMATHISKCATLGTGGTAPG